MGSIQRPATIEDVARVAGVSRAAVSKVIRDAYGVSDDMRARVEVAIDELSYRPRASARAMRGSSYTLGFEIPNIHNQFFPKLISGGLDALTGTRYQLIIAPGGATEDGGSAAIEALADRQVDGLVVISPEVPETTLNRLGSRLALVMIGCHRQLPGIDTIVGDDRAGAALAVGHLHQLGFNSIVHFTLPDGPADTPHAVRLAGYREAMQARELQPQVIVVDSVQQAAREAALKLLSAAPGPVGIFAAHDELALGVLEAVAELGLSAAQASVVGYDDIEIAAHPNISLTSINQSGTQMGSRAVELLLERIAGRTEAVSEVMTPKLMVRGTTAPAAPQRRSGAEPGR